MPFPNILINGDCLEVMKYIASDSINLILCDLPYGITQCKWDSIISLDLLWEQYKRITKNNSAIVLTGSQPFTSKLIMSNIKMFKYCWVWEKSQAVGHLNAWKRPMRNTEDIIVFYKKQPIYNVKLVDKPLKDQRPVVPRTQLSECYGTHKLNVRRCPNTKSMPRTIIKFNNAQKTMHPTQKPVALFEYLIKTYTNEGDLVLDNCAGSFTTAIASENTKRNWICIEKELKYCEIGKDRIIENRKR